MTDAASVEERDAAPLECEWCRIAIRSCIVIVGPPPGREVRLMLDVDPHPDGTVITFSDGRFRKLARWMRGKPDTPPAFRIHGKRSCSPEADITNE